MHIITRHTFYTLACICIMIRHEYFTQAQGGGVELRFCFIISSEKIAVQSMIGSRYFRIDQIFSNIEGPRFFRSGFKNDPKIYLKRLNSVQFESRSSCRKQIIYQWSLLLKIADSPFIP